MDDIAIEPTTACNECGYKYAVLIQVVVTRKPQSTPSYQSIEHWCRQCVEENTEGY